jgi:hypothetical protein
MDKMQLIMRSNVNNDVPVMFEKLLDNYFNHP